METTSKGVLGVIGYILGLHRDNGKENGKYYIITVYYSLFALFCKSSCILIWSIFILAWLHQFLQRWMIQCRTWWRP